MASDKIKFKIITHEEIVFEDEVDAVYAPGTEGRFGVLPNHIPCIYPLKIGVTKAIKKSAGGDEEFYIATMGGIFRFYNNEATILTDVAEMGEDIDLVRANEAKERAKKRLTKKSEEVQVVRAELALSKAIARINAREKKLG